LTVSATAHSLATAFQTMPGHVAHALASFWFDSELLVLVGVAAVLLGVLARGLHRLCLSFVLYLAAVVFFSSIETARWLFPHVEWLQWWLWTASPGMTGLMKVAVAIELADRILAPSPEARKFAATIAVGGLATTGLALRFGGVLREPLLTYTTWILVMIIVSVARSGLTLHPWHHALLVGLVAQLFVHTTFVSLSRWWELWDALRVLGQLSYLAVVSWWVYSLRRNSGGALLSIP